LQQWGNPQCCIKKMAEDLKNIGRHEIAPHQGAIRGTNQM
jgi:hypothetical protein